MRLKFGMSCVQTSFQISKYQVSWLKLTLLNPLNRVPGKHVEIKLELVLSVFFKICYSLHNLSC
jgi:hypothetical protein